MLDKICATVILYNPDESILTNINTYINNVSKLFVVDNSEIPNSELINKLLSQYPTIEYINNKSNLGIATALNIACDKAITQKMDWILTMDQDSKFVNFKSFLACFIELTQKSQDIGIITPNHTGDSSLNFKDKKCLKEEEKEVVITSGNMINLKYFNHIGRFDDKLFIDMVDYDFSNKMILNNLKIHLLSNHYIIHNIGEVFQRKNLFTRKVKSKIEHNAQRVYYMTRNRLYLSTVYSKKFPKEYNLLKTLNILFIHDITKILLYEDKKLLKIKAKTIGLIHFITNQYGRYNV